MTSVMTHTPDYMTSVMAVQAPVSPHRVGNKVVVLGPNASNLEAVLAMLARCSRTTLFRRFHGFTDGVAYHEALLRDRPVDQTLLAWYRSTCVGVASLGVGAAGNIDLAVLVEDAWQRRGVATQLAESLLARARAKGVTTVHADVLGDDLFILQALRRIGPLTVSIEFGIYSVDIDISSEAVPAVWDLPSVGFETVTGGDHRLGQARVAEFGQRRGVRR
jgi:GNAT superfamily N-acetyltransferase